VQLRALEREAKSQRDLLESYLAKYREATARDSIGAASPDARIISRAVVSTTPAYPKKLATVLVAALGMFVLSVGFILSGELLGAVSSGGAATNPEARHMAEREGDLMPSSREEAPQHDTVMPPAPDTRIAQLSTPLHELRVTAGGRLEAIESLARELGDAGAPGRRISVIGARADAATTQTAISLARSLAKQGTVVLVDL